MISPVSRKECRRWRHERIRRKVRGTAVYPRMAVMVSGRHVYVQFVDDDRGHTLASVSSLKLEGVNNAVRARKVGEMAGQAAAQKGIRMVVVDRSGFKFHGCVKAVVDGAVAAGVKISEKPPKQVEAPDEKKGDGAAKQPKVHGGDKASKKPEGGKPAKTSDGDRAVRAVDGGKGSKGQASGKAK